MKLNYDAKTDSLYIQLSDAPSTDSKEISKDVILDTDAQGRPVGVDIQHASTKLNLTELETTNLPTRTVKVA